MAKAKAKPKAKPKAKAKAKPKAKPTPKPKAKPAPKPRAKPKAKPTPKAKAKPKAKPARKPRPSAGGSRRGLYHALERMAEYAGPVRPEHVPPTVHALWTVRGTFYLPQGATYDTVAEILEAWSESRTILREVGENRTARIQVAWDAGRGRTGEYTLAEIGPWGFVLGRAIERVTVRDGERDGLVQRYGADGDRGTSSIRRLYVWFGEELRDVGDTPF